MRERYNSNIMNNLFVLNETFTNGYRVEILDFLSLLAILCGVFVIISKNPIVSILFLIGLFLSISIYLIMLGLNFIGISYLLVYVGAVSILFLFILMLINIRVSELLSSTSNTIPLAIIIAISFYTPMYEILPYSIASYTSYTENLNTSFNDILLNNTNYFNQVFKFLNDKDEIAFVTSKL
jgi:NADH-ubiquinone oxidoreductase chain 6